MRILLLAAVAFLVIAFICTASPTAVLSEGWSFWFTLGMLSWALDVLLGGYVLPTNQPRT